MRLPLGLALAGLLLAPVRGPSAQDAVLDSAEALLRSGAAWQATQLLQPRLTTVSTRTPAVLIAAARAAAGWQGWSTVWSLLHGETWLDTRFDGVGHRLLAEAALERNDETEALGHARLAIPRTVHPRSDDERARRWIVLARAHERAGASDSAAAAYTRAAPLFPAISDWLALRAAAITPDSATRARLYSTVTNPVARTRIRWTEARAWERGSEKTRAAREYAAVGDLGTALRLRWEASADRAVRGRIAAQALAVVERQAPAAEVSQVLDLIDSYRLPMARSESLMVARASATRRTGFAVALFAALERGATLAESDRLAWGDALAARGDWLAAARTYRSVDSGPLAGRTAYLAARADLRRGQVGESMRQLRTIVTRFPGDTFASATALYLLADLALDDADPDSARALLTTIVARYPSATFAPRAALIAPLIAYAHGRFATARDELAAALRGGLLTGFDGDAGRYWLAVSMHRAGAGAEARDAFRQLLDRGPENYYALKAAARLDTLPWRAAPVAPLGSVPIPPGLVRAELLATLGLDDESQRELGAFVAAPSTVSERLEAGRALLATGHASLAHRLAREALAEGAERDAAWPLLYPLPYRASLEATAQAAGLDPWLVAAVIKQESWFEPSATSPAGARGLMQLMPPVGRQLASRAGLRDFDDALLWQPEISLGLGTRHFAEAMRRYPERERALAAYNAGGTRVTNWSRTLLDGSGTNGGALADAELFVERIPYLETRGYIRNITVNEAMYRLLYDRR
jgi:soluble lytic murein transglycosylase